MTGLKIVLGLLACVLHASAYETATGGDSYIIDGHNASQHQFPWIVSLRTVATNRHVCGGFILGDRWVGTSAECIRRASLQSQTVVVASGAHTRTDGNIHHVIRIIRHPRFSHISMTFDFALLQTANKIPITPQGPVRAIKCATGPVVEDDASVITAGWGIIKVSIISLLNLHITIEYVQYYYNMCSIQDEGNKITHQFCNGNQLEPFLALNVNERWG